MRILYLSPREAWPPNSGAKLRDLHFAHGLGGHGSLTYLFFGSERAADGLRGFVHSDAIVAIPPPPKYTVSKLLKGIVSRYPLPVQNYRSAPFEAAIRNAMATGPFDLIHLDSLHMAGYVPLIRKLGSNAPFVLDWHNIESEAMVRFAQTTRSTPKRFYAHYTGARLKSLEMELLRQCAGHIVCSERERAELESWAPGSRVAVVANGVDSTRFHPSDGVPATKRLVFVGQMSYHANADGIIGFVRDVWPTLHAADPGLTLNIVGADPGPAVRALGAEPGITVTGTVPDVRDYYRGALAAVVPLRTGGGTRLKILEAMAAGVPVISTALGAEGLSVDPGQHFLLADKTQSWVDAVATLSDSAKRDALTYKARELVCRQYDWKILGNQLAALYAQWAGLFTLK